MTLPLGGAVPRGGADGSAQLGAGPWTGGWARPSGASQSPVAAVGAWVGRDAAWAGRRCCLGDAVPRPCSAGWGLEGADSWARGSWAPRGRERWLVRPPGVRARGLGLAAGRGGVHALVSVALRVLNYLL